MSLMFDQQQFMLNEEIRRQQDISRQIPPDFRPIHSFDADEPPPEIVRQTHTSPEKRKALLIAICVIAAASALFLIFVH